MAASEDDQLAIPADPIRIVAECPTLHLSARPGQPM